jgi:NAD(P)H-dependent FMN reductase
MRYKVVAISGALEHDSKITNIIRKCMLLKTSLDIELVDIKQVPLLNVDLVTDKFPASLEYLRSKVFDCDGLLFVVPEFFGKVSPAFKNVYDWLSYSPDAEHPSPIRGMSACLVSVGD